MSKRTGIMLCYPFTEEHLNKWRPPYIIQPKLDGDRCRGVIDSEGNATLLSSEENIIESVPHINEALKNLHLRNVELDGELYLHGAAHEDIHSVVGRTVNLHPDYKMMEYHVFDIVYPLPQTDRTRALISLNPKEKEFIKTVPSRLVYNIEEVMSFLEDVMKNGYEGFVIRDKDAPYVRKRSTQMMKFKPRRDDIYEIIGYEEEVSKEGIPKNSLGAIICRGNDATLFNVGSGSLLTRENREKFWRDKESLIGKYAHVKYQHMTSARGVPRFPVIVDIIDALE